MTPRHKEGWHMELTEMSGIHGAIVRVSLIQADGSTPCETGAAMTVAAVTFTGTVGGGALEQEALKAARTMLSEHAGGAPFGTIHSAPPSASVVGATCGCCSKSCRHRK